MTWASAVADRNPTVQAYAELVDYAGRMVPVTVDGDTRVRLPLEGARVSFSGDSAEQWSADLSFSDPWMVPTTATHPLWGTRALRVRLYWQVLEAGEWLTWTVCTLALGNSSGSHDGLVSGTVRGRDMLSLVRDGYGAPLAISTLTVDAAMRAIIDRCAPSLPHRIAASDVVVGDRVTVGEQDPLSDLRELAAIGWPDGVIRTDREGVMVAGPRPTPPGPVLNWQEGDGCPVVSLDWEHGVEHMGNRVTVVSTHPDAVGVFVVVEDDDPSSPTYVGGGWGVRPLTTIKTDKITDPAGLRNLGLMALGKGLKPTITLKARAQQRPDLMFEHPVQLAARQLGVSGVWRVAGWSLTLPTSKGDPEPMEVELMQRFRA